MLSESLQPGAAEVEPVEVSLSVERDVQAEGADALPLIERAEAYYLWFGLDGIGSMQVEISCFEAERIAKCAKWSKWRLVGGSLFVRHPGMS